MPFRCGRCLPCRIYTRKIWTARQVLESFMHDENSFLTLTYNEDQVPENGTLVPKDVQLWMKRFRKAVWKADKRRIRFFLCGEYGDQSWRPHYHASLFGVGPTWLPVVQKTWEYGFSSLLEFNQATAQYTAGYVVKKLTDRGDRRLKGRYPEFSRKSNRPGIGAGAMKVVKDTIDLPIGRKAFENSGDVPEKLLIGRKSLPLGRYLREKLRDELEMTIAEKVEAKQAPFSEQVAEMQDLLRAAIANGEVGQIGKLSVWQNATRILQVETRAKISASKGRQL